MFPDKKPVTPPTPASLPPVQFPAAQQQAILTQQPSLASDASANTIAPVGHEQEEMVEKVKLLASQYGSNPYAFNAAFQQLKSRYLLDRYHIDANAEKN